MIGLDNVFFPGWVDRPAIEALSEISIASIAPYKNIENYIVNTPNKIVDALSLGLPILSPLSGEVKNLIHLHDVGFTYADDLDECIMKLIHDPDLSQRMAQNAKKLYYEEFDYETVYGQFVSHMENIVNTRDTCYNN